MTTPENISVLNKSYKVYYKRDDRPKSTIRLCSQKAKAEREYLHEINKIKQLVCPKLHKSSEIRVLDRTLKRINYLERLYAELTFKEVMESWYKHNSDTQN